MGTCIEEAQHVVNLGAAREARRRHHLRAGLQHKCPEQPGLCAPLIRVLLPLRAYVDNEGLLQGSLHRRLLHQAHPLSVEEAVHTVLHALQRRAPSVHHAAVLDAIRGGVGPHNRAACARHEAEAYVREEGIPLIVLWQVIQVDKDGARPELAIMMLTKLFSGRVSNDDQPFKLRYRQLCQGRQALLDPLDDSRLGRPQHARTGSARLRFPGPDVLPAVAVAGCAGAALSLLRLGASAHDELTHK
mmetsp:Transcript_141540/g.394431  ORF Transcript_141540/g.394431 Transcript_141540/m.394431 type:complete len:245 (-) Transcript_141540:378-1112(-)